MPSNRQSNPNRQIAAVHRIIDSRLKPNMVLARVVSVPPHGSTALIRIGGSATLESAEVLGDLKLQPNDTVIIIRPEQSAGWFILSAYTRARSGTAPRVPSGVTKLAAPGNVTLTSGTGFNLLTWETPPNHPNLSYQVEVGDAPEESESNTVYQVRGSVFLDVLTPGTTKSYRVLCVDNTWNKSAWSDWKTEAAGGGVLTGTEAEIPSSPTGIFFATDTNTLYIGDGSTWNAILSGGAGGSGWDVDSAPASPSGYDDEFNDSSIDIKWAEYDPDTMGTESEIGTLINLTVSGAGSGVDVAALYQTATFATDFTIVTKIRRNDLTRGSAGIAFFDDHTDPNARVEIWGLVHDLTYEDVLGIEYVENGLGGSYISTGTGEVNWSEDVWYYLRVRHDSANDLTYLDLSLDGVSWSSQNKFHYLMGSGGSGDISAIGIGAFRQYNNSADLSVDFEFFRVREVFDSLADPVYGDGDMGGVSDHGDLTGLDDDDHPQYHNDTRGDARYYQKTEFIDDSTGISDAGKPVVLDTDGLIALSMLPTTAGSGVSSLDDLDDVDLSVLPTDGQALVYDGLLEAWIADTIPGSASGSGADALGDLIDVDLSTPPTDGQVLTYDSMLEAWIADTFSTWVSGGGITDIQGFLIDNEPGDGQFLRFSESGYLWSDRVVDQGDPSISLSSGTFNTQSARVFIQNPTTLPIRVYSVGIYSADTNGGTFSIKIWDSSSKTVLYGEGAGTYVLGWNDITLDAPTTLMSGTTYYIETVHSVNQRRTRGNYGSGGAYDATYFSVLADVPTAVLRLDLKRALEVAGIVEWVNAPRWVSVPASAGADGVAGDVAYDSDYLYVCVATDTWKRVAIGTW